MLAASAAWITPASASGSASVSAGVASHRQARVGMGVLVCEIAHTCPVITGVSPTFGGSEVTITGANLSGVTQVMFGDAQASSFQYIVSHDLKEQGFIEATPPEPQYGETVPVYAYVGQTIVPTTAMYSYPLGYLTATGPFPFCETGPDTELPSWDTLHFLNLSHTPGTLVFTSSNPVLHLTTQFTNDSGYYPFNYSQGTRDRQCGTSIYSEGDGATFSATVEMCTVGVTSVTPPAPTVTTLPDATTTTSQPMEPGGACTNWDGNQGQWVPYPTVSEQLTVPGQLDPDLTKTTTGDLALQLLAGQGLSLENSTETLRVVAEVQETDSYEGQGNPLPVPNVYDRSISAAFNVILAPVAVAQANAVPYTIIYAPPGDQSTSSFTSAEAFGTDYTVGTSTAQTNSTAKDESFESDGTFGVTSSLIPGLNDVGFNVGDNEKWDQTTKTAFGDTETSSQEITQQAAFSLARPTSPDWNDWPGSGTTCTALTTPAPDHSLYDCGPSGIQLTPAETMYNHAAFWDDVFELVLHPQYAIYRLNNGGTQYVMLGADPSMGERNVQQLYDCELGVEVDSVDQCQVPYTSTGLIGSNGGQISYTSAAEYAVLSPDDAKNLLALDPFFVAGSQGAPIRATRGEPLGSWTFGAYASGAVAGKSGSSESANAHMPTYSNTQATKNTTSSMTSTGLEFTNVQGSEFSVGTTVPGSSFALKSGLSNTSVQGTTVTYSDSTAVGSTQATTSTATLSDVDNTTPGNLCPAPSPTGPSCHGPLRDASRVNVFLDRLFGSLMYVDPAAPPRPKGLSTQIEKSLLPALTLENLEGAASQSSGFTDVKAHSAASVAIGTLTRLGLMSGFGRQFRPNAPFTAADLATSLGRSVRLNTTSALKTLTGSANNPNRSLDEQAFAHALVVGLGLTASRADAYVGSAYLHYRFRANTEVTRADAAIALLPALSARCLRGCHVGS
jgi:hypothetical protein